MLCTSVLSEVVLGFMLWSGWLGTMHAPSAEYDSPQTNIAPDGPPASDGQACPQACQPLLPPPLVADCLEIRKIQSMPKHLAACDVVQSSPNASPTSGGTRMPCKKPCYWSFQTGILSRSSAGVIAEVSLIANNDGTKETYTTKHFLRYDTPTNLVLSGDNPEPVCVQVVARAGGCPRAIPQYGMPMIPPPPMCLPMPSPSMPLVYPKPSTQIPDPIPMASVPMPLSETPSYWLPQLTPVGLSVPVPTPAHRATVKLVYESGKPRLCVQSEGMKSECLRMKLEAGAAGALRLSAGKDHVHVAGTKWKAQADRVELGDDGRIVLTGHVKLLSDKLGVCAAVKADRMCVQVKAGKFEKIVDQK